MQLPPLRESRKYEVLRLSAQAEHPCRTEPTREKKPPQAVVFSVTPQLP